MPLFTVIIIVFQFLVFLGHWFLYKTAVKFLGLRGTVPIRVLFVLLSVSFTAASVLVIRYNKPVLNLFYTFSAAWLGVFHFLLWCSFFCWLALWVQRALGLHFILSNLGSRFGPSPWAAAIFSLGLLISVYSVLNAGIVRTREIDVTLPGLPEGWGGRTAVWISDLHLGPVRGLAFAREIAKKVKLLNPDILFIGGDLYDGTSGNPVRLVEPFAGIKPPLGAWFIT